MRLFQKEYENQTKMKERVCKTKYNESFYTGLDLSLPITGHLRINFTNYTIYTLIFFHSNL